MTPETLTVICPLGLVVVTVAIVLAVVLKRGGGKLPDVELADFARAIEGFFEAFAVGLADVLAWIIGLFQNRERWVSLDIDGLRECVCGRLFEPPEDDPDQLYCFKCLRYFKRGKTPPNLKSNNDVEFLHDLDVDEYVKRKYRDGDYDT